MPKMIVSIDEVVIKEVQLTKDRTTVGRRPYNDVVIDNLAVSGEHAVILMNGVDVMIEDLNSTNGTYVNGKAVKKQPLQNGDSIEIGKYKIKFVGDHAADNFDKTMVVSKPLTGAAPAASYGYAAPAASPDTHHAAPVQPASIRVLSGAAAGREVPLTKVVTTIGKPGVAVAAITKRQAGFVVHHVEGGGSPTLNGAPISADPLPLKNGDVIELAGTQMQFVQS
jgi:pSer/pThr/pTyr-binding forkhead associated (FHA) protein